MWQLKRTKCSHLSQYYGNDCSKDSNRRIITRRKIPSERKLAEYLSVNRSTVVHALDELVDLGWIVRKRGSGTIVNEGKWG